MKIVLLSIIISMNVIFANSEMSNMDHNLHNYDNDKSDEVSISKRILDSMHEPMKELSNTKNIEVNFLTDMIPHHQGAINSSKLYLDHGKNEQLKAIAKNIISSQEEEIRYFVELLNSIDRGVSKNYDIFYKKTRETMNKTMKDMGRVKASGNVDVDFIKAMIFHHQGAIQSAKDVLRHTENDSIKDIAKNIIQAQEQEIKSMQDILKTIQK